MVKRPLSVLIVENDAQRSEALISFYKFHDVVVVGSAHDAIDFVKLFRFDVIHLDYDLNGTLTGADVAASIPEPNKNAVIIIHSENPTGVGRIISLLPQAFPIPISALLTKSEFTSSLKALLAQIQAHEIDEFKELLSLKRS